MPTITIAYFAAARAAAGVSESVVDIAIAEPATIASALARGARADRTSDYDAVVARCSFLVNGIATTDPGVRLHDGDRVDVLPPFAGG